MDIGMGGGSSFGIKNLIFSEVFFLCSNNNNLFFCSTIHSSYCFGSDMILVRLYT